MHGAATKSQELKFYCGVMGKNALSAICHLLSWQPYFQLCSGLERKMSRAQRSTLEVEEEGGVGVEEKRSKVSQMVEVAPNCSRLMMICRVKEGREDRRSTT